MIIGAFTVQPILSVSAIVIRAIIIYAALLVFTRIMGKREMGHLVPFAFIVSTTIGSIASEPLTNGDTTLVTVVTGMGTVTMVWLVLAYLSLRNNRPKDILGSRPVILIRNGQLDGLSMRCVRMTPANVMSELRLLGFASPDDVEFAVTEPSGEVSVIPKSEAAPLRAGDAGVSTPYRRQPAVLSVKGQTEWENLKTPRLDEQRLVLELRRQGYHDPAATPLAVLDSNNQLVASKREVRETP